MWQRKKIVIGFGNYALYSNKLGSGPIAFDAYPSLFTTFWQIKSLGKLFAIIFAYLILKIIKHE